MKTNIEQVRQQDAYPPCTAMGHFKICATPPHPFQGQHFCSLFCACVYWIYWDQEICLRRASKQLRLSVTLIFDLLTPMLIV